MKDGLAAKGRKKEGGSNCKRRVRPAKAGTTIRRRWDSRAARFFAAMGVCGAGGSRTSRRTRTILAGKRHADGE